MRPYGSGDPDRAGYLACINARSGPCHAFGGAAAHGDAKKLVVAEQAAAVLVAMNDGGLLLRGARRRHLSRWRSRRMIAVELHLHLAPDPVLRLGALAIAVTEDARRLAQRLRLSNAEAKRLDSMGHRWWRLRHGRRRWRGANCTGLVWIATATG